MILRTDESSDAGGT